MIISFSFCYLNVHFFNSTLLSQPNKAIRPSTESFFDFNEIWHVGKGRWVMHNGMQYDLIQVMVTSPSKLEIHFRKLSPLPFTVRAGNWPRILELGNNIYILWGRIFDICPSFCVTWLWTWQKRQLWRVDRQSRTWLIYMKKIIPKNSRTLHYVCNAWVSFIDICCFKTIVEKSCSWCWMSQGREMNMRPAVMSWMCHPLLLSWFRHPTIRRSRNVFRLSRLLDQISLAWYSWMAWAIVTKLALNIH